MSIQGNTSKNNTPKAPRMYMVLGRDYPDGSVEMVSMPAPPRNSVRPDRSRGFPPELTDDEKKERRRANNERCAQRARAKIKRLCRAIGVDRLTSLTFWRAEDGSCLDRAWARLGDCLRRLKKSGWMRHMVVVPELQERGVWHFHLAYKGFIPKEIIWPAWSPEGYQAYLDGEGPGGEENPGYDWVDVGKAYNYKPIKMKRVVRYLCKYLSKGYAERVSEDDDEEEDHYLYNRRRYSSTHGAMQNVREWRMYFDDLEEVLAMLSTVYDVEGEEYNLYPIEKGGAVVGYHAYCWVY